MFSPADHQYMARALQLARHGLYTTTPNPRVGCVIVRDGAVVGEGWHERAGEPHAEVIALRAAGARARNATVYVTLEPCNHHGRTPPCVDALIEASVATVVFAMQDPDPRVSGAGFQRLRAAGVAVERGLLESEAQELNIGFVTRMRLGRPWVRIKTAASLDGRTALQNGRSQWITSAAARTDAHRWRARSCAVMAGIGTLLADNPRLTVRHVVTDRQPVRIIVDRHLEIPADAAALAEGQALIFCARADLRKAALLRELGIEVLEAPGPDGKVDLAAMMQVLGQRGLNEVLVESGNRLNGALLRAGVVDELLLYLAPQLLGDSARGMFDLGLLTDLDQRRAVAIHEVRQIGGNLRILARLK